MTATLDEFLAACAVLETEGLALIARCETPDDLTEARTALLGRRSGRVTALMERLAALPVEERRHAGAAINRVKLTLEGALAARASELAAPVAPAAGIDLTMPARAQWKGAKHPVTLVMEEIEAIFRELGFTVALGPEA